MSATTPADLASAVPPKAADVRAAGAGIRLAIWALIIAGFVAWSGRFILLSSYLAPDGRRYYSLFDDAMISMRYAWNLTHGAGLVWNQGERVEAITNVLMTLFMAPWTWLFDKPGAVLAVQVSGVGMMLAIAALTARIGAQLRGESGSPRTWSQLDFAAALAYYPLVYWALLGMETALLTVILLAAVSLAMGPWRSSTSWAFGVTLGLLFWCRPEQVISIVILLAYRLSRARRERRGLGLVLREAAVAVAFIGALTLFRHGYYGRLTPNTYALKVEGIALADRIRNGVGFIKLFLCEMWPLMGLGLLHVTLSPTRERLALYGLFLSSVLYQIWAGGDPWWFWRIMCPTVPLLFVLCLDETRRLCLAVQASGWGRAYLARGGKRAPAARICAVLLLGMGLWVNARFLPEIAFVEPIFLTRETYESVSERIATGLVLSKIGRRDATVGVVWAGTIPYYAGLKGVDFLGKADPYIASLPADVSGSVAWCGMYSVPGHNKYDLSYSLVARRPTYVQWFFHGTQDYSAFGREHYVKVTIDGVSLSLLEGSPDIDWARVRELSGSSPLSSL